MRTFVYKLRPTREQAVALDRYLDVTRDVYNAALEQRRTAYRMTGRSPNWYAQKREVKDLRAAGMRVAAASRATPASSSRQGRPGACQGEAEGSSRAAGLSSQGQSQYR